MKKELIALEDMEFILVTTRVKNINLRILHDGTVRVSAPYGADKDEVISFVQSKKQWILKHRDKYYLKDGEFLYLGEVHRLEELGKTSLAEFYSKEAVSFLTKRYSQLSRQLVDTPPQLIIKPMRGKYGYYTKSRHEICLNARLIMAPPDCIDYVIVHELMHTLHYNHGKHFHEAVSRIIPEEKQLREKLSKYILW